jgi:type IV pilus assembly protein PilY1
MITVCMLILLPGIGLAVPDLYKGDTAIYSGSKEALRPNVLIIFDNNSTMGNSAATGDPYDPNTVYAGTYDPYAVYKVTGQGNYVEQIVNTTSALENVSCSSANISLQTVGTYSGSQNDSLKNNGACGNGGAGLVYLGNLLNYNEGTGSGSSQSQVDIVRQAVINVVGGARGVADFGLMVFGENKSGGKILRPVADLSSDTDYADFISVLPGTPVTGESLLSGNGRPLGESLYDAGAYFKGVYPIIYNAGSFLSPIQYDCQSNFVVVITNGDTDNDGSPKMEDPTALGQVGDYDGDGLEPGGYGLGSHYMDDVAKYIYENDMNTTLSGTQRVVTHAVQVFSPEKTLVRRATDGSHGRGLYYVASDANALSNALTEILNNIVLEADTSFVAPVVPVSPENRTYSGSRVYLGFFKPISQEMWHGNLKKYGIDSSNNIVDQNGAVATNSDGSFKDTSLSFWSTIADGGAVEAGGAGEALLNRDFTTSPRAIYTYLGTSSDLTDSSNAFTISNAAITLASLGVSTSTDKDSLINFIHGLDAYDEDSDGNTTEKRAWILGDILHSKPLVINYASYSFSGSSESDCSLNKSMIYVGANDGLLHAFRDCDGSEAWAFIPQDLLSNLAYLAGKAHSYFVDSSPSVYIYDADSDGNIETADGDKAIIVFGQRRGGNFYYALDVSDPEVPRYFWRLSPTETPSGGATDYAEMGQTWSEPEITKMKIAGKVKVAAIIGAGYDNANEDGRYGATQTYDGLGIPTDIGEGYLTSSGTSGPLNPKGRGVYIIEVATLNSSGVPDFNKSGRKIWGFTNADAVGLSFSVPGAVTALDRNFDSYTDRFYAGDTGGNIWRFDVGDSSISNWTGRKIFSSNPGVGGPSDVGRKIFYKPSIILEADHAVLFFGTGDRAHPLNTAVVDRLYAIKDRGETGITVFEENADDLHELVDVTTNDLQADGTTSSQINSILADLDTKYGWYIRLDQNLGEKVLARALAFGEVFYTTYAPDITVTTDPCNPGNLGTARAYLLSIKAGEAVFNFDTGNDGLSPSNSRATNDSGEVLQRSDRVMTLGYGIPSGVVLVIKAGGDVLALVGCGGALCAPPPPSAGNTFGLYWKIM